MGNLAAGLTARGFQVTILTVCWDSAWPTNVRWRETPVVRLLPPPTSGWNMFRFVRRVGQWLRENEDHFDLVYACGLKHEAYAALRNTPGHIPVVLRAESAGQYGDCVWQVGARRGRRIKRLCMKAAALVGGEQIVAEELRAAGYPRPRIHHLSNGVSIARQRTAEAKTASRTALATAHVSLDMPSWAPLAVCTGLHFSERTLGDLVVAWQPVTARWPNARLWLADGGKGQDTLQRRIVGLNLAGRVVQIGRFDDVGNLLAAADLFVQPSRTAGTSLPLLEAMGAGLPIVAVDDPLNRELITDGQHGLLVPPDDPSELANVIQQQPDIFCRRGGCHLALAFGFDVSQLGEVAHKRLVFGRDDQG